MADIATPAPAPGADTTEYRLTRAVAIVGLVLTIVFSILTTLQTSGVIPDGSKAGAFLTSALALVSMLLSIVKAMGYTSGRVALKTATLQAAAQAAAVLAAPSGADVARDQVAAQAAAPNPAAAAPAQGAPGSGGAASTPR